MQWRSIDSAPKDGRPVWVRCTKLGKEDSDTFCSWCYWNGKYWYRNEGAIAGMVAISEWLDMEPAQPETAAILPDGSTARNVYEAFEAGRKFEAGQRLEVSSTTASEGLKCLKES